MFSTAPFSIAYRTVTLMPAFATLETLVPRKPGQKLQLEARDGTHGVGQVKTMITSSQREPWWYISQQTTKSAPSRLILEKEEVHTRLLNCT